MALWDLRLLKLPYDACLPTLLGHAPCFFPFDFSGGQVSCSSSQGQQDLRLLWVLIFAGHKDSVTCAGFSHDSTLVATGDMSGLLKVWQVDTKEEVWSFEAGDLEVSLGSWTRRRVHGGVQVFRHSVCFLTSPLTLGAGKAWVGIGINS